MPKSKCLKAGAPVVADSSVRATLLEASQELEAPFQELVNEVCKASLEAPKRSLRLNRPMYGLRILIVSLVIGVIVVLGWVLRFTNFSVSTVPAQNLLEVLANTCDCLVLVPCILAVFFLEVRIKRGRILEDLKALERLNDNTYEMQFNENAHSAADVEKLIKLLDVCCGLLLLVRVAAGAYSVSSDPVVLERIGVIRRGCNDNHRNILMKISMAMTKRNGHSEQALSVA